MKTNNYIKKLLIILLSIYILVLGYGIFEIVGDIFPNESIYIDNSESSSIDMSIESSAMNSNESTVEPTDPVVEPSQNPSEPTIEPSLPSIEYPMIEKYYMDSIVVNKTVQNNYTTLTSLYDLDNFNENLSEKYFCNNKFEFEDGYFDNNVAIVFSIANYSVSLNSVFLQNGETTIFLDVNYSYASTTNSSICILYLPNNLLLDTSNISFFIGEGFLANVANLDDINSDFFYSFIHDTLNKEYSNEISIIRMLDYKKTPTNSYYAINYMMNYSSDNLYNFYSTSIFSEGVFYNTNEALSKKIINESESKVIDNKLFVISNKSKLLSLFNDLYGKVPDKINCLASYDRVKVLSFESDYFKKRSYEVIDYRFNFVNNSEILIYSGNLYTLKDAYSENLISNEQLQEILNIHNHSSFTYYKDLDEKFSSISIKKIKEIQYSSLNLDNYFFNDVIFSNYKYDIYNIYSYFYTKKVYPTDVVQYSDSMVENTDKINIISSNDSVFSIGKYTTLMADSLLFALDFSEIPELYLYKKGYSFNFDHVSVYYYNVKLDYIKDFSYIVFNEIEPEYYYLSTYYILKNDYTTPITYIEDDLFGYDRNYYKIIGYKDLSEAGKLYEKKTTVYMYDLTIIDLDNKIEDKKIKIDSQYTLSTNLILSMIDEYNEQAFFYENDLITMFSSSNIAVDKTLYYVSEGKLSNIYKGNVNVFANKTNLEPHDNVYLIVENKDDFDALINYNDIYFNIDEATLNEIKDLLDEGMTIFVNNSKYSISKVIKYNDSILFTCNPSSKRVVVYKVGSLYSIDSSKFKFYDMENDEYIDNNICLNKFGNKFSEVINNDFNMNVNPEDIIVYTYPNDENDFVYIFETFNYNINENKEEIVFNDMFFTLNENKMLYVYYKNKVYTLEDAYNKKIINESNLISLSNRYKNHGYLLSALDTRLANYDLSDINSISIINNLLDAAELGFYQAYYMVDNDNKKSIFDEFNKIKCYNNLKSNDYFDYSINFLINNMTITFDTKYVYVKNKMDYIPDYSNITLKDLPKGYTFKNSCQIIDNGIVLKQIPAGKLLLKEISGNSVDLTNDQIIKCAGLSYNIVDNKTITIDGRYFEIINDYVFDMVINNQPTVLVEVYDNEERLINTFKVLKDSLINKDEIIANLGITNSKFDLYSDLDYTIIDESCMASENLKLFWLNIYNIPIDTLIYKKYYNSNCDLEQLSYQIITSLEELELFKKTNESYFDATIDDNLYNENYFNNNALLVFTYLHTNDIITTYSNSNDNYLNIYMERVGNSVNKGGCKGTYVLELSKEYIKDVSKVQFVYGNMSTVFIYEQGIYLPFV